MITCKKNNAKIHFFLVLYCKTLKIKQFLLKKTLNVHDKKISTRSSRMMWISKKITLMFECRCKYNGILKKIQEIITTSHPFFLISL